MDQREEFVRLARQPDSNVSELCRRFQISRKTGYKWLSRKNLEDRSRRPHGSPIETDVLVQARVLAVRDENPAWGARKIAHVLQRDQQIQLAPSTANSILRRNGRISAEASQSARPWQRFEHEQPNSMWQMDFKGHFATGEQRCHPLTVLDDHSRFNIVLQALSDERRVSVQPVLQRAFEVFGLPQRINTDNGAPWGSSGQGSITELGVWLVRLGVKLSHSRPLHPQTNGKDERFHRTMKAEVLAFHEFADLKEAQQHLARWRHRYNFERPHESLDMQTPSTRYRPSPRSMPSQLPPIEYLAGDLVRRVQQGGRLTLKGQEIRVSTALAGQPVACRPSPHQDGEFTIHFCHQQVGAFNVNRPC